MATPAVSASPSPPDTTTLVSCDSPTLTAYIDRFAPLARGDPTERPSAVPANSMPSVVVLLNPSSVNVTEYVPGRRFVIWYWPVPSLVAVRDFSMSTGLAASTVTPGSTRPDASLTTPANDACPYAVPE